MISQINANLSLISSHLKCLVCEMTLLFFPYFDVLLSSHLFQFLHYNHILIYFLSVHSWDTLAQEKYNIKLHCFIKISNSRLSGWWAESCQRMYFFCLQWIMPVGSAEWDTVFYITSEYVRADPHKDLLVLQPYAIIRENLSISYFLHR